MSFLATALDHKRTEVAMRKDRRPVSALPPSKLPRLDFKRALGAPGISLIAEIKRKSPSRGFIAEDADAAALAASYRRGGAAAISVLTDHRFFGGTPDDLVAAKTEAVAVPVLRKDFIVDEYQLHESRHLGADAVLLIVAALSDAQLAEFVRSARELELDALVEVHSESELDRALCAGAAIVGVNSRDLATLTVDRDVCLCLRGLIPPECLAVAESGVRSRDDVLRLADAGYDALLVGEALMVAPDPALRVQELMGRAPTAKEPDRSSGASDATGGRS